jgi:hypothetical protein
MILNGDKSIENIISLKERELLSMMPKSKQDMNESIIMLEMALKIQIDINKTSVKKYYGYIKFLQKKHDKN